MPSSDVARPNQALGAFMRKVREAREKQARDEGADTELNPFSRENISKHFGHTQGWLSNIENGIRGLSVEEFMAWARLVSLTEDEWAEARAIGEPTEDVPPVENVA